jgi:glycosyltransferase involved in cell wall biosynthesis
MKRVSVITTFYNTPQFICKALDSVLKQKLNNCVKLEYILVDDCSTDNTRSIVEEYIKTHQLNGDWKIITPEKNLGCGGARRYGIEHATGDYFMFLDADDYYINSDFILRAYCDIIDKKADIVEYGIIFNQPNGVKQNNAVHKEIVIDKNPHLAEIALFRDNFIKFNVWTKIYTRQIVESYQYSDRRTFEDVMTIPVWIANAKRIVIMPSIEINYRAASDSIIRSDWSNTRLGTISAIASHFERWKDDKEVIMAMYNRAMIDLEAVLNNHSSENEGFNEMSKLNTYMLKYIYPNDWKDKVYEIE